MRGTWQTTGGSGSGALLVAGVIGGIILVSSGALAGAVAAAVSFLEVLLLAGAGVLLAAAVACFLLWRKFGHRSGSVPEQIATFHEARQVRVATQRAAIATPETHYHLHFGSDAQPEAVLRAIAESKQEES
jgi:membrane protein implicated in regulation of membrane protease activity